MRIIFATGLILLLCLMPIASHASRYYVRATVDSKIYRFGWDFNIREDDDGTHLIKNSHANQSDCECTFGKID